MDGVSQCGSGLCSAACPLQCLWNRLAHVYGGMNQQCGTAVLCGAGCRYRADFVGWRTLLSALLCRRTILLCVLLVGAKSTTRTGDPIK